MTVKIEEFLLVPGPQCVLDPVGALLVRPLARRSLEAT